MGDKPTTGTVSLNDGAVRQKHRMAAGLPVTGQTTPPAPKGSKDAKTGY
jgi:hypothetical protein